MTAMERVDGRKVTDPGSSPRERRRLARTLIEALIAQPFWSDSAASAIFHADPHAGNLFVTDDGRLRSWTGRWSPPSARRSASPWFRP
jgi:ubiquinone biosynthesis protein